MLTLSPEIGGTDGGGQNVSALTAAIIASLSQTAGVDSAGVHVTIEQTSEIALAVDPAAFAALSEAARALLLSQQEAAYSQAICGGSTEIDLGGGASVALTCSVSAQPPADSGLRRRLSVPMLVVTRTLDASASLAPPSVNGTTLSVTGLAATVTLTQQGTAAEAQAVVGAS